MRKPLLAAFITALVSGYTSEVKLINLDNGATLIGSRNLRHRSIQLRLPSGEMLDGHYVPLKSSTIGSESVFSQGHMATMPWLTADHSFRGYARLVGKNGKFLEIVFSSEWPGHGTGFAKTNDGGDYEVIL